MENNENMMQEENSEVSSTDSVDAVKADNSSKVPFFKQYGATLIVVGVILIISAVCGVIKSGSDKKSVVSDISDTSGITKINPFDKITVQFTGFDGSGEISVVNENEGVLGDIKIDFTKSKDLSNGETITASISSNEAAKYPSFEFTGLEKSFTVEGLLEHDVTDMIVTDDDYNILAKDAQNKLVEYNSNILSKDAVYDMELIGSYMVSHRDKPARSGLYYVYEISNIKVGDVSYPDSLYQVIFYNEFAVDSDNSYVFNIESSNFLGSVSDELNLISFESLDSVYYNIAEQYGDAVTYTAKGKVIAGSDSMSDNSVSGNDGQ